MGRKVKLFNRKALSPERQENIPKDVFDSNKEKIRFNTVPSTSGLFGTKISEPRVNFIKAQNELIVTDDDINAFITLGRDRPSHLASGYGGKGAQRCNTIDLVVGRASSNPNLKDGVFVNNSFGGDAARVYISQLTDIDTHFGIDAGMAGSITQRSAIGIKADAVRLIGREGIKIVTGRSFQFKNMGPKGETNSLGGTISQPAPPIELIAGNQKEIQPGFADLGEKPIRVLQGAAKGEYVRDAFRELSGIIDDVWTGIYTMATFNNLLFSAMAVNVWHPHYTNMCTFTIARYLTSVMSPLWHARANKFWWDINYTNPGGKKYVMSRNVYIT